MKGNKYKTLLDHIKKRPFPKLEGKQEIIQVVEFKGFFLELWDDGSVTWMRNSLSSEEGK